MIYGSRDELEAIGRVGAKALDMEDYYLCRVLSSFWVAIGKDDNGLIPHIKDGFWEPWIMLWISKNVRPGGMVADVGANVGFYTFQLAQHGCYVDAYEPNPEVYAKLMIGERENYHLTNNIELWNKAVSKDGEPLEFCVPYNNPMNGGNVALMHEPWDGYDRYTVESTNRIKHRDYDFIKIDVEGGETEVFELLDPELHPLVLMEFRWDRYMHPEEFGQSIFDKYPNVSQVDWQGEESAMHSVDDLAKRQNADWMLVLRA